VILFLLGRQNQRGIQRASDHPDSEIYRSKTNRRPIDYQENRMAITQIFIYLQLLDLLTTLVGFRIGAGEASPFIRILMHAGPTVGVLLSKVLALGLGGYCVYSKRLGLMRLMTYWCGGLVVWNLTVLLSMPGTYCTRRTAMPCPVKRGSPTEQILFRRP
jgi:hypothetical protein